MHASQIGAGVVGNCYRTPNLVRDLAASAGLRAVEAREAAASPMVADAGRTVAPGGPVQALASERARA
ncbi:hypothetical protein GGD83_004210 [Rhodoblastus sphagnicola]|nr:hypothetical protein [Rhodoblastus sphagnicola]